MSKYDVTALGELLIDFTENGTSAQGNPVLEANPGGAPCNVLSMLNRLGHKTNFIGKIGKDMFGDQLEAALKEVGIGTDGLMKDDEVHTTLAFVHTAPDGDREFSFYRNPGADMMLSEDEVDADQIKNSTIFHFGSLSMTDEVCRKATRKAIAIAEEAGVLMSYDPNLREPLWKSMDLAKEQISYGLEHCNILKISDNEIQWLTGKEDYDEGIAMVQEKYNIPLILLSLGKTGSRAYTIKLPRGSTCLHPGEYHRDHRRRRHLRCVHPALRAGARLERVQRGRAYRDAHLRQCGGIHRDHEKRRAPRDADKRRSTGNAVERPICKK